MFSWFGTRAALMERRVHRLCAKLVHEGCWPPPKGGDLLKIRLPQYIFDETPPGAVVDVSFSREERGNNKRAETMRR